MTPVDHAPHAAAAEIAGLYDRHAAAWVRRRGTRLIERDWLAAFRAALPPGRRAVLDIGCGTGVPIAAHLIARGCRLTGVDAAHAMLARARAAFPAQRWIQADMRALPDLGTFDGILAWHSFFHLPPTDQPAMFAVFRRLAAHGAVLMFTSGTEAGEALGEFEGEPLYHGSLATGEYLRLLAEHGFSVLRHVEQDPGCGGATVWLARREA